MRKLLAPFVILSTFVFALMGSLAYKFAYPAAGDDGAQYLNQVISNSPTHNYGVYLLKPLLTLFQPIEALTILSYVILLASIVMVWLTLRRYSIETAVIGTPVVILGSYGVWQEWFDGSIFAIAGLLVFNLATFLCADKYHETGKTKWLLLGGLLPVSAFYFHRASGLYIVASLLLFAIVKRLLPTLKRRYPQFVWFENKRTLSKLLILLSITLAIGGFMGRRLTLDLSTILTMLLVIGAVGMIKSMPARSKMAMLAVLLVLPLMSYPAKWSSNYTAIRAEDLAIINRINQIADAEPSREITVSSSYGESPFILHYFFRDNVQVVAENADYIMVMRDKRYLNRLQGQGVYPVSEKYLLPKLLNKE